MRSEGRAQVRFCFWNLRGFEARVNLAGVGSNRGLGEITSNHHMDHMDAYKSILLLKSELFSLGMYL